MSDLKQHRLLLRCIAAGRATVEELADRGVVVIVAGLRYYCANKDGLPVVSDDVFAAVAKVMEPK